MFAATRPLFQGAMPSFWSRSITELKRQAGMAVRMDGICVPEKPFHLIQFTEPAAVDACKIICDSDAGGFSRASLTHQPGARHRDSPSHTGLVENDGGDQSSAPSHALFRGSISTELPPRRPDIQRSGYAAWRTRDRGWSLFGKLLWDTDPFAYLALRVKSDGRKYFVNIQTESVIPTDLHQHLLPARSPGEWETVTIPLAAFVRTSYGMVVEPQTEMLRQKVRSVGIGLTDRVPGPFELRIADVYATNRAPDVSAGKAESGFELEPEDSRTQGMMGEIEPRRRKGEPERILI